MNAKARNFAVALGLSLGGLGLMWALTFAVENVWYRMAVFYLIAVPVALLGVKLEWKALFKPTLKWFEYGLIGGALLYCAGWVGGWLITQAGYSNEISGAYSLLAALPAWQVWPLLIWIILGEEIVWRNAVTLSFTDKWRSGGVFAGGAAFTLVHLPWGPPLLIVAALVFGTCWSWMVYKTRSFWPAFVAHVFWDVLVMFVAKY
jgi:membrane protease YdiL (CAAX protease family)